MLTSNLSIFQEGCFLEKPHSSKKPTLESLNDVCEYHQCIGMSIVCLFFGMVLGMLLQKYGAKNLRLNAGIRAQLDSSSSNQLELEHGQAVESIQAETESNDEHIECTEVLDEQNDKHVWRRGRRSSEYSHSSCVVNFTKSMLSLRGTLFANSMRKLSTMSGGQHGLIEARGKVRVRINFALPEKASCLALRTQELEIVSIDATMHEMLGWPSEMSSNPDRHVSLPSSVHDLLPADIRSIHRRFLSQNRPSMI
jgi:hypothetical protein